MASPHPSCCHHIHQPNPPIHGSVHLNGFIIQVLVRARLPATTWPHPQPQMAEEITAQEVRWPDQGSGLQVDAGSETRMEGCPRLDMGGGWLPTTTNMGLTTLRPYVMLPQTSSTASSTDGMISITQGPLMWQRMCDDVLVSSESNWPEPSSSQWDIRHQTQSEMGPTVWAAQVTRPFTSVQDEAGWLLSALPQSSKHRGEERLRQGCVCHNRHHCGSVDPYYYVATPAVSGTRSACAGPQLDTTTLPQVSGRRPCRHVLTGWCGCCYRPRAPC